MFYLGTLIKVYPVDLLLLYCWIVSLAAAAPTDVAIGRTKNNRQDRSAQKRLQKEEVEIPKHSKNDIKFIPVYFSREKTYSNSEMW